MSTGSLFAIGSSAHGQLGAGNVRRIAPAMLPTMEGLPARDIVSVACGDEHSIVVLDDGSVYACGCNEHGELGNGTRSNYALVAEPLQATGTLSSKVVKAVAGGHFTLLLTADGNVYGCGFNFYGQLGLGHAEGVLTPTRMSLNGRVAVDVVAGHHHAVILCDDGKLLACGRNDFGQLGDGSHTNQLSPVPVKLESRDVGRVVSVAAGWGHTLFLTDDGRVFGCGNNFSGQLATGTKGCVTVPIECAPGTWGPDTANKARSIAAGDHVSVVIGADGAVRAFGHSNSGIIESADEEVRAPAPVHLPLTMLGRRFVDARLGESFMILRTVEGEAVVLGTSSIRPTDNAYLASPSNPRGLASLGNDLVVSQRLSVAGRRVTGLACGRYHALFMTEPVQPKKVESASPLPVTCASPNLLASPGQLAALETALNDAHAHAAALETQAREAKKYAMKLERECTVVRERVTRLPINFC